MDVSQIRACPALVRSHILQFVNSDVIGTKYAVLILSLALLMYCGCRNGVVDPGRTHAALRPAEKTEPSRKASTDGNISDTARWMLIEVELGKLTDRREGRESVALSSNKGEHAYDDELNREIELRHLLLKRDLAKLQHNIDVIKTLENMSDWPYYLAEDLPRTSGTYFMAPLWLGYAGVYTGEGWIHGMDIGVAAGFGHGNFGFLGFVDFATYPHGEYCDAMCDSGNVSATRGGLEPVFVGRWKALHCLWGVQIGTGHLWLPNQQKVTPFLALHSEVGWRNMVGIDIRSSLDSVGYGLTLGGFIRFDIFLYLLANIRR